MRLCPFPLRGSQQRLPQGRPSNSGGGELAQPRAVVLWYRNATCQFEGTAMSLELMLLVWSIGLTFIQMLVAVTGAIMHFGLPDLAGNREGLPYATGWAGRAQRAHRNMLEHLVLFAVLVLV